MKKIFLIANVLLLFSCASNNKNNVKPRYHRQTHVKLTDKERTRFFNEFTLKIPSNWFGYVESHSDLALSPRIFLPNSSANKFNAINNASLTVRKNYKKGLNSLEDFLKFHIDNHKKYQPNRKFNISEATHPKYGKTYIIHSSFYNKLSIEFLINNKDVQYVLAYASLEEHYKKYINDVALIVDSFTIKELL